MTRNDNSGEDDDTIVVLQNTLGKLRNALKLSFCFRSQFKLVIKFLDILKERLESETIDAHISAKSFFNLIVMLRKLLAFVEMNFNITERKPKQLPLLRQTRCLLKINILRREWKKLIEQLKDCFLTTSLLSLVPEEDVDHLLSIKQEREALKEDFVMLGKIYSEVAKEIPRTLSLVKYGTTELIESFKKCSKVVAQGLEEVLIDADSGEVSSAKFEVFENICFWETLRQVDFYLREVNSDNSSRKEPVDGVHVLGDRILDYSSDAVFTGRFGTIYTTKLIDGTSICIQVVPEATIKSLSRESESHLLYYLRRTQKQSPSSTWLVNCLGHFYENDSLFIALEGYDFNLHSLLHGDDPKIFSAEETFSIFFALTKGLEAIHSAGIVHGDINPLNINFVSSNTDHRTGCVKLGNYYHHLQVYDRKADFSVVTDISRVYQAPEVLLSQQFSYASDVYSLAICLWECTQINRYPFQERNYGQDDEFIQMLLKGERPIEGSDTTVKDSEGMLEFVKTIWKTEPWRRLHAITWVDGFEKIQKNYHIDVQDVNLDIQTYLAKKLHIRKARQSSSLEHQDVSSGSYATVGSQTVQHLSYANPKNRSIALSLANPVSFQNLKRLSGGNYNAPVPSMNYSITSGSFQGQFIPQGGHLTTPKGFFIRRSVPPISQKKSNGMNINPSQKRPKSSKVSTSEGSLQQGRSKTDHTNSRSMLSMNVSRKPSSFEEFVGVDGLTVSTVRHEIQSFLMKYDKQRLKDLDILVEAHMKDGLHIFHKEMLRRFGKGLQYYNAQNIGYDGISKAEVQKELEEFYHQNKLKPEPTLEAVVKSCLVKGLEQFHDQMMQTKKRGLKRFTAPRTSTGIYGNLFSRAKKPKQQLESQKKGN